MKRKPSCRALKEILRVCEVSRGGGDIPTTCSYLSSSLFIVVNESSLLWRAKSSVGSSYGVLDVNILYLSHDVLCVCCAISTSFQYAFALIM